MSERVDLSVAPWEVEPSTSGGEADLSSTEISEFSEFSEFSSPEDRDDAPIPPEKEPLIDEIASEYVGFWNLLVSKTNWEKGKVIHSWRAKLIDAGLPRRIYSDDAIATRIGNVSPQHVGRLRRVYERFGDREPLPNLYWSHYQAALDWDDADAWLQKASDEKLSVAQTRLERWEKTGAKLNHKPKADDEADAEKDEDVNPYNDSNVSFDTSTGDPISPSEVELNGSEPEKKSKKKKSSKSKQDDDLGEYAGDSEPWEDSAATFTTAEVLEAIGKLDELPSDLAEALEQLKISILSHKLTGWAEVHPVQIAAYLSELKRLLVSEEK